jgi:hypothetical protein
VTRAIDASENLLPNVTAFQSGVGWDTIVQDCQVEPVDVDYLDSPLSLGTILESLEYDSIRVLPRTILPISARKDVGASAIRSDVPDDLDRLAQLGPGEPPCTYKLL